MVTIRRDPWQAQDDWAGGRDWRPSRAAVCPRPVAGLHCLRGGPDDRCVCDDFRMVFDHARMWLTPTGKVMTFEPYDLDGQDVAELVEVLKSLNLTLLLTGGSPWNPGATLLGIISKRNK